MKYAQKYAELSVKNDPKKKPTIMIAAVIPGNPFPVIEHPHTDTNSFKGKPCQAGFQSHFTVGWFFLFLFFFQWDQF